MLETRNYYIDLINSSKANQFTAYYHYSGVGFKKAKINQGIYRKTDNKLVGVLQWGCSAQEGIRLDKYVLGGLDKNKYLELNRFCMADSEGHNAESQAISLGIKWIKANRKDIELLVSYAGRKEGNYGYIYQATNWEYLGYFVSDGFWILDGKERHQLTAWYYYNKYGDNTKGFRQGLCELFNDVRQTWSKQFIYIQRLNKKLQPATAILPYPKPTNEFPIQTRIEIYKEDKAQQIAMAAKGEEPSYYYEKEKHLFSCRVENKGKEIVQKCIAIYDNCGDLDCIVNSITDAALYADLAHATVSKALTNGKKTGECFFRWFDKKDEPQEKIEFDWVAMIDGIKFVKQTEIANYCNVSRQAVSSAAKRKSKEISGKSVIWFEG